jgi:predicted dehydrogenase
MGKIGVGIIGASGVASWAARSHVPALAQLQNFELRALSTTSQASADDAARRFGVPLAFDNHRDLIAHPDVELVVISVRVPYHHEIARAIIEARKPIFCEWPLGNGLIEAIDLAERAEEIGIRNFVGLQGRYAPEIAYARDLITQGYIGTPLATTLVGSGRSWGAETTQSSAYMFDPKNGATLLSIAVGHALDTMMSILGEVSSPAAILGNGRHLVRIADRSEDRPFLTHDHVAIQGVLASGGVASIFYRGGMSRGDNLRWEINGTEGDLILTADYGHVQIAKLALFGGKGSEANCRALEIPESYRNAVAGMQSPFASNTTLLYDAIARDLRDGTQTTPSFSDAVRLHQFLDRLEAEATKTSIPAR